MRRWIIILTVIVLLVPFFGCNKNTVEFQQPVNVYYCRRDVAYNTEDGVLYPETREFSGYEDNLRSFLNQYLRGPGHEALYAPFSPNSWILDLTREADAVRVVLSVHFSLLSGQELTLSCACISKTIMEITGCQSVYLYLDGTQNNKDSAIIMSKEKLLLMDTAKTN